MNKTQLLNRAADNIRILAAAAVEKAKSGHPGGAMGGADFINVLFSEFLEYDPDNAGWKHVTVSSSIRVTWLRCCTVNSAWQVSSPSKICRTSVNGAA